MNTCHNTPLIFNGYSITQPGRNFIARKNNITLQFIAEGRNGGLYWKPVSYYDGKRLYSAQRYLYKIITITGCLTMYLADNDYLWDYEAQEPLTKTRSTAYANNPQLYSKRIQN